MHLPSAFNYFLSTMQQRSSLGFICALLAVSIWSGNFIIASGFVGALPPITLAALRWTTATIFFLPFAYKYIRKDMVALRQYGWQTIIAAISGVTLFNTLVYISARTTDTANMALFASTTPIFVVILSRIFLKEAISIFRAVGLVIAISGMLTIATRGNFEVLMDMTFRVGDIWMLLAGFLWAVYSILVKKKTKEINQYSFLGAIFLLGVIPLIPAAFIEQQFHPQWVMTPAILGATLYIGLGASLAAFFLWNSAVMIIGPGTSSLFQYFMPVFSGIGAYFLLGQPITFAHAVGFILIFTGVVLATRPR
ncbi:DMT family transporter [Pseudodesulfovibrio sp.]|nr:DMT family transporter [Pseudodesulfovibrio sp.]